MSPPSAFIRNFVTTQTRCWKSTRGKYWDVFTYYVVVEKIDSPLRKVWYGPWNVRRTWKEKKVYTNKYCFFLHMITSIYFLLYLMVWYTCTCTIKGAKKNVFCFASPPRFPHTSNVITHRLMLGKILFEYKCINSFLNGWISYQTN